MCLRIVVVLLCLSCTSQNREGLKTISWDQDRPLEWHNFEADPVSQSEAAATTASGITFGFSINKKDGRIVDFSTTVECLFYPEKSWVKPEHANGYILRHEQLHFDITELYARKFRQKISRLKVSQNIQTVLNRLYKDISRESNSMQERYDEETDHSRNKEKQAEWDAFITRELQKFKAYTSS